MPSLEDQADGMPHGNLALMAVATSSLIRLPTLAAKVSVPMVALTAVAAAVVAAERGIAECRVRGIYRHAAVER